MWSAAHAQRRRRAPGSGLSGETKSRAGSRCISRFQSASTVLEKTAWSVLCVDEPEVAARGKIERRVELKVRQGLRFVDDRVLGVGQVNGRVLLSSSMPSSQGHWLPATRA